MTHRTKYTRSMRDTAEILVRLSQRRDEEGGLERQEADARDYCARLGIPVGGVHREVQSAYAGKRREGLEAALEAAKGGHLVVWKLDRLTRRGVTGLGEILQRLERDGTTLHSVTEALDARTPMGRAVLGVLAGVAEQSSADASLRIRRAFEEKARQGQRHAGGKPPFGWGEGEAALVREAAQWVTSGGSLRSLCQEWNERGLRTSVGGLWQSSPLSRLLRNESLLGVRVHLGERYPGDWEPVLTEAEFSAVGAALARNKATGGGKTTLLRGILVCGACGEKMRSSGATEKSKRLRYKCVREPGRGEGCGRVSIYRDLADAEVERQVNKIWALWEAAAPIPRMDPRKALELERAALAALVEDHYVRRLLSRELFLPAYQKLQDRISELEAEELEPEPEEARTIEQKLRACVSKVTVKPTAPGPRLSVEERVRVSFRFGWLSQRSLEIPEEE